MNDANDAADPDSFDFTFGTTPSIRIGESGLPLRVTPPGNVTPEPLAAPASASSGGPLTVTSLTLPGAYASVEASPAPSMNSAFSTFSRDEELLNLKSGLHHGTTAPGSNHLQDSRPHRAGLRSESVDGRVSPRGSPPSPSGSFAHTATPRLPSSLLVPPSAGASLSLSLPSSSAFSGSVSRPSRGSWIAPLSRHKSVVTASDELIDQVMPRLHATYYQNLTLDWKEMAEVSLFGGLVSETFADTHPNTLFAYVLFANPDSLPLEVPRLSKAELFRHFFEAEGFFERYKAFTNAVAVMKSQDEANTLPQTAENENLRILRACGEFSVGGGYKFPLASCLYLNWLLQFGEKSHGLAEGVGESGVDTLGERYARYGVMPRMHFIAKCSYLLALLFQAGYFEEFVTGSGEQEHLVSRYVDKDNLIALGLALQAIANYHQDRRAINLALHYYECAANLCSDLDCLRIALMGISSGEGYGNVKDKETNAGVLHVSRRKRLKFENKRRVAQLSRLMEKRSGAPEFGGSWIWKEKYD